ncbi:hypothetical protein Cri9333_0442 [Crinalium epipsammum PCC 9333]|uniref:Uncharacterized protein n=1 Tax=Crinalium epipsammum PCC 9333 TaxID=1173022 RepID=K9VV89_9CYAN|nr:hypothetical protein [Crinalium epipsammum]AFZ11412.1 hypothetical protein Cri9333_0442 [Crinalium epipsammum PCC 9333]
MPGKGKQSVTVKYSDNVKITSVLNHAAFCNELRRQERRAEQPRAGNFDQS